MKISSFTVIICASLSLRWAGACTFSLTAWREGIYTQQGAVCSLSASQPDTDATEPGPSFHCELLHYIIRLFISTIDTHHLVLMPRLLLSDIFCRRFVLPPMAAASAIDSSALSPSADITPSRSQAICSLLAQPASSITEIVYAEFHFFDIFHAATMPPVSSPFFIS